MKQSFLLFKSISIILSLFFSIFFTSCISTYAKNTPYFINNLDIQNSNLIFEIQNNSIKEICSFKFYIELECFEDEETQQIFEKEFTIESTIPPNEANSFSIDLSNLIQENLFDHDLNIDEYKFSICKFYITEIQYYDNSTFYDKYGSYWI